MCCTRPQIISSSLGELREGERETERERERDGDTELL